MYYHLQSATLSPCSLTDAGYTVACETWLCPGCCAPLPGTNALDVQLDHTPHDGPLNFVNGCGVPVALWTFLDAIGKEVVQHELMLGRVYGPDGTTLQEWATFRGKQRLIIRGTNNVSHRRCSDCGRHVYFAMGRRYLFPEPPDGVEIFESDLFGLVLSQHLYSQIEMSKWTNISVDELPVLKAPNDSLGDLR